MTRCFHLVALHLHHLTLVWTLKLSKPQQNFTSLITKFTKNRMRKHGTNPRLIN